MSKKKLSLEKLCSNISQKLDQTVQEHFSIFTKHYLLFPSNTIFNIFSMLT